MPFVEPVIPVTWDSLSLTLSAVVHVAWPPGSYEVHADDQFQLYPVLEEAMKSVGLGDQVDAVFQAMSDLAKPHFAKSVADFEKIRQESDP